MGAKVAPARTLIFECTYQYVNSSIFQDFKMARQAFFDPLKNCKSAFRQYYQFASNMGIFKKKRYEKSYSIIFRNS